MFFYSLFTFLVGRVHLFHVSLLIHPSNRAERERIEMPTKMMIICEPRSQMMEREVKTYLSTIMMCEPKSQLLKKEVKLT